MTPEELSDKFTNMKKETEEGVLSGLKAACIIIVGKAYDNCSPAKTPYFRPIWVTGNLAQHLTYEQIPGKFAYLVGTDVPYARKIHEGTPSLKPRPFLLDAIESSRDTIIETIGENITICIRKVTE